MNPWWLCPNSPPCGHAAVLHDVEDFDDVTPRCCIDGCACGARTEDVAKRGVRQKGPGSVHRAMSTEEFRRLEAGSMTETQLLEHVRDACRKLGLHCYHTHDSRRSERGFPDLVIVGRRVLFRELKSETGRVSPEQRRWLNGLEDGSCDAEVWRPSQWVAGKIQQELRELVP